MDYKPYSPEWHRYRYLKEALDKYLEDGIDPTFIMDDLRDILHIRSEANTSQADILYQSHGFERYLAEEIMRFDLK